MTDSNQNKQLQAKVNSLSQKVSELQARLDNSSEKALQERIKELQCLYNIASLSQEPDLSIPEFLQKVVTIIPPSWQYPEITCTRIQYNDNNYITSNFRETPIKQTENIVYHDKKQGSIEVFYLEEKPTADEGPFLKEERKLLDAIAQNLSQYLERKETAAKHQQSKEYLRVTLNSIGDGVIATDTEGKVTLINPVAEKLTGWSFQDSQNRPLEDVFVIVNSQTGEKASNPVEKVLKTGQIVGLANHTKLIAKNGKEYQIADSGSPIKDKHDNIIGVVLVFRNVTKEYNMQEKVKSSEKQFRTIVEGAPEPIFIQIDHKFAYLNPAACKLFGINSPDELTGTPVIERFHPDFHKTIKKRIHKLNKEKKSIAEKLEQRLLKKDGSEIWVETVGEPIEYMGKNGGLVFVRDISQRKKNEEKLRKDEEKFRTLFYETPLGIIYYDNYGVVIDSNETFVEIIGATQEKIIGVDMLNDLKDNAFINAVRNSLSSGKGYYEGNYTSIKGNKTTSIRAIFKGIKDVNDNITSGMALVEDISERKKAEEKLRTLKNNLQTEVEEKTKELQKQVNELQRFHDATIEREFRIKELRDEIDRLKGENS